MVALSKPEFLVRQDKCWLIERFELSVQYLKVTFFFSSLKYRSAVRFLCLFFNTVTFSADGSGKLHSRRAQNLDSRPSSSANRPPLCPGHLEVVYQRSDGGGRLQAGGLLAVRHGADPLGLVACRVAWLCDSSSPVVSVVDC